MHSAFPQSAVPGAHAAPHAKGWGFSRIAVADPKQASRARLRSRGRTGPMSAIAKALMKKAWKVMCR